MHLPTSQLHGWCLLLHCVAGHPLVLQSEPAVVWACVIILNTADLTRSSTQLLSTSIESGITCAKLSCVSVSWPMSSDVLTLTSRDTFLLRSAFPFAVMRLRMGTTVASLMPDDCATASTLSEPPGRMQSSSVTFLDYLFRLPYTDYHWDCHISLSRSLHKALTLIVVPPHHDFLYHCTIRSDSSIPSPSTVT